MKKHTIASTTYIILENPPILKSGRVAARLATQLGGLLTSINTSELSEISDNNKAIPMLVSALNSVDTDMIYDSAIELLDMSKVYKDGSDMRIESDVLDVHFNDQPENLFPFLVWLIKEVCGGYFLGLGKSFPSKTGD